MFVASFRKKKLQKNKKKQIKNELNMLNFAAY